MLSTCSSVIEEVLFCLFLNFQVVCHYVAMTPQGRVFDSSLDRGKPYDFRYGVGVVLPGWNHKLQCIALQLYFRGVHFLCAQSGDNSTRSVHCTLQLSRQTFAGANHVLKGHCRESQFFVLNTTLPLV